MLSLVRIIIAAFAKVKKFLQIKLYQFNNIFNKINKQKNLQSIPIGGTIYENEVIYYD